MNEACSLEFGLPRGYDGQSHTLYQADQRGMPADICKALEGMFSQEFKSVRIITSVLPKQYGALAFTQGHRIYIRPGYFEPNTCSGLRLLACELAHAVQQAQERAKAPPNTQNFRLIDNLLDAEARQAAEYCVYAIKGQTGAAGTSMPIALRAACKILPRFGKKPLPIQCGPNRLDNYF